MWGNGAAVDKPRALKAYTAAAERGHTQSQYQLGENLLHGVGGPPNHKQAFVWIEKAAAAGERGGGRGEDGTLLTVTATTQHAGHSGAVDALIMCYFHGKGCQVSFKTALHMAQRSSTAGRELEMIKHAIVQVRRRLRLCSNPLALLCS